MNSTHIHPTDVPEEIGNIKIDGKLFKNINFESVVYIPFTEDGLDAFIKVWEDRKIDAIEYHKSRALRKKAEKVLKFIHNYRKEKLSLWLNREHHLACVLAEKSRKILKINS